MQAEIDPAEPRKANRRGRRKGTAKEHPATNLMIGAFLLIVGIVFGVIDLGDAREDHRLMADGVRTQGVVTEVDFERMRKRSMRKVISVAYDVESGRTHSTSYSERYRRKKEGSTSDVYWEMVGSKVPLFYDPAHPGKAVVEGDERSFSGASLRGGGAVLMSTMFLVPAIRGFRKKRKAAASESTPAAAEEAATSSGT
ncbi:DUF3592 domain-containing protein [Arthrobacter sp. zg-Y769]|uniref:DUF3592 domain-containing protein n=1 Tax=Arthrobacter sp. zg-Y769 TaxID=2894191 RepID=UPI001E630226|nr:DUF3592 domain-containing protein [Arthrobacter sp. zg-Y769]MCC9204107.1 DUF3592 domain-containing protein [Arthrobacter sp. zg-Y769]